MPQIEDVRCTPYTVAEFATMRDPHINQRAPYATPTDADALARIVEMLAPGQELGITEAIDIIADAYTVARMALARDA